MEQQMPARHCIREKRNGDPAAPHGARNPAAGDLRFALLLTEISQLSVAAAFMGPAKLY